MNSKKILSLVLAGTMALGICSCDGYFTVKPDGPTEVEEETTTEEETTEMIIVTTEATSETTTKATTESSDNTSETSAKNTSEATAPASLNSNMEGTIFVSFKGKLAYEVKENLINMTKITRGVTMDNYADVFTDYPNDTVYGEDYKYCTYYWDSVARNSTEGINNVMVHIVRKTDGSLDPGSRVQISLICEDRDRWDDLYGTACDALKTVCNCTSLIVTGSGDNESSSYSTYFVTKKLLDDGRFSILIELPFEDVTDAAPAQE